MTERESPPDSIIAPSTFQPLSEQGPAEAPGRRPQRAIPIVIGLIFAVIMGFLLTARSLEISVVAENEARFARVVISNTGLPDGSTTLSAAFMMWKRMNQGMIDRGDIPTGMMLASQLLQPEMQKAYDAPFPSPAYKAGALIMPQRVPVTLDDPAREANLAAWVIFEKWEKPFLTAFGDGDPVTRGLEKGFQERVPGAKDQPHVIIEGGGHFIQETNGEELAGIINKFISDTK